MKNFFSLLILTLFTAPILHGQVLEETRSMSTGSNPALTIVLPGADAKFADSEWKEFMKPYGKVSRIRSAKENVTSDVQILDIGGVNRLNLYSLSEEVGDGTKFTVWFDLGTGFVSSEAHPKEYVASVNFMKEFAKKVQIDLITLELQAQEKLLSKAESNLSKLKRENENYHKIIEDSKKRIAEAEKDIDQNLKDQESAQKEIGAQQEAVSNVQKKLDECKKD